MDVKDSGKWYCEACGEEMILGQMKSKEMDYYDAKTGQKVVRATRKAQCPHFRWWNVLSCFVHHSDGGIVFQSHLVPDDSKNGWVFISN